MKRRLLLILFVCISGKIYSQLSLHAVVQNTTCQTNHGHNLNGLNIGTGRINITATGGIAPYTYAISGSHTYTHTQNNGYFPQLYIGNYTITVTDAAGLSKDTIISISSNLPIPSLDLPTYTIPSSCTGNDGSLTYNATAGTAPFLYSINGGASYSTSNMFKNLSYGLYICDIQDANGCISYSWIVYIPTDNRCGFSAYANNVLTSCESETDQQMIEFLPYTSVIPPYKISYNDSDHYKLPNNIINRYGTYYTNDTLSVFGEGFHDFYVKDTVTNKTFKGTFAVGLSCTLNINLVSIDASCSKSDGGLTVTAKGGVLPYTYSMDGVNWQTDNTFKGLPTGNYTVSVMDATGALSSAVGIVYNKCPVISVKKTYDCSTNLGTILVTGTKGVTPYQYSMDGIHFTADSVFNNISAGSYTITLKDANGFKDSVQNFRIFNTCLNVTFTGNDPICISYGTEYVTVHVTGGTAPYNYQIFYPNGGSNTLSNSNIFNVFPGTFRVVVVDSNAVTDTVMLTIAGNVSDQLKYNLGNDTTLCYGQTVTYLPNLSAASYTWQDGSTGNSYTVSKAGKYWVNAKLNGCTGSDTVNVTYLNLTNQIFNTHDTTLCVGNSITLNAQNPGAAYLWNSQATTQTQTETTSGKYWVQVKLYGCSASDTINLHFITGPSINLPKDTSFCSGKQVTLHTGNTAATYLWNNNTTQNSITVNQAGKYWVAATQYGCTNYDTIQVTQNPAPSISLGNDTTLCEGTTWLLNATTNNATYVWQDGTSAPVFNITSPGKYSVKVTASDGCDTTGLITVNYITRPVIHLGNDTTLCLTDQLILNAYYYNSKYLWQDGTTGPTFDVSKAGLYKTEVTNTCGSTSDSISIQFKNCDCEFFVPNAFTPNGDGLNDIFKPGYKCYFSAYSFQIYNRWGQVVFSTHNPLEGWDGRLNGLNQPLGTYVWEISFYDTYLQQSTLKKGVVVLIR